MYPKQNLVSSQMFPFANVGLLKVENNLFVTTKGFSLNPRSFADFANKQVDFFLN